MVNLLKVEIMWRLLQEQLLIPKMDPEGSTYLNRRPTQTLESESS
jgi:hypothetical protein